MCEKYIRYNFYYKYVHKNSLRFSQCKIIKSTLSKLHKNSKRTMRDAVMLQSAQGSHDILHSLKEFVTDNSCSVAPGTMSCESKELIQAKIGSKIGGGKKY
jgi:hypothetical protein